MNTIIASGSVTGNVGSCKVEVSEVLTKWGLFMLDKRQYATNSCTGQVDTYDIRTIGPGFESVLIICGVLAIAIVIGYSMYKVDKCIKNL